jgi:hypothetical protein
MIVLKSNRIIIFFQKRNVQRILCILTLRKLLKRDQLSEIYPIGQDNRPFPEHEPMEYGIFVGQIIEANGTPRMNTDVRWEYELRGIAYE